MIRVGNHKFPMTKNGMTRAHVYAERVKKNIVLDGRQMRSYASKHGYKKLHKSLFKQWRPGSVK